MKTTLERDAIQLGDLRVSFQRTLRIPDNGREYPLPPSLGTFPIHKVDDYRSSVPASWLEHGGVFLPMYQREAMWLRFHGRTPMALKVAAGMVNAVSGDPWSDGLKSGGGHDYVVCPTQPWLDGFNSGKGQISQFVAMPLGMGYTVEGQVTGEEKFGGLQLVAYAAKEGAIPPAPVREGVLYDAVYSAGAGGQGAYAFSASAGMLGSNTRSATLRSASPVAAAGAEMGLAAGGKMRQKIYEDPYGHKVWDQSDAGRVYVHIVNSQMYREITGRPAPESPVSAQTYSQHGMPWFDLYDEGVSSIGPSEVLEGVKSVAEMDADKGFGPQMDDSHIQTTPVMLPVKGADKNAIRDGGW